MFSGLLRSFPAFFSYLFGVYLNCIFKFARRRMPPVRRNGAAAVRPAPAVLAAAGAGGQSPPPAAPQVTPPPSTGNGTETGNGNGTTATGPYEWESGRLEFSSALPTETKEITWRIKDFSSLQQLKGNDIRPKIKFEAGKDIDMLSKWRFDTVVDEESNVGFFMCLEQYKGTATKVLAKFETTIKSGDGSKTIVTRTVAPTDMKAVCDWGFTNFTSVSVLTSGGALKNDEMAFHIKFTLYGRETMSSKLVTGPDTELENEAKMKVLENFGTLLSDDACSDFTIKVSEDDSGKNYVAVKVHKAILSARSDVFKTMIEAQMKEAITGEVTIDDISPAGLNIVLKFLYTGTLDPNWVENPEEVVNAAEKYEIPNLKGLCDRKLHKACTTESAFRLLKLAKFHTLSLAEKKIADFISTNMEGIIKSF